MKDINLLTEESKKLLAQLGYAGIFAEHDNLQQAQDYFADMINSINAADRIGVTTAHHVVINTFLRALIEKYYMIERSSITIDNALNYPEGKSAYIA